MNSAPAASAASRSARVQHRARADNRAGHLLHRPDHIERGGRAQRHFEHRQAARDQRLGDRHGMGHILDHQHRDHRRHGA